MLSTKILWKNHTLLIESSHTHLPLKACCGMLLGKEAVTEETQSLLLLEALQSPNPWGRHPNNPQVFQNTQTFPSGKGCSLYHISDPNPSLFEKKKKRTSKLTQKPYNYLVSCKVKTSVNTPNEQHFLWEKVGTLEGQTIVIFFFIFDRCHI